MHKTKTFELIDVLQEIQRITSVLLPLVEEGREEAAAFRNELGKLLQRIFPTNTVAVVGPVGSGKSTLLSVLLKESGAHPIASISPTNETFAPMSVGYGAESSLVVRYFSIEILHQIEEHLRSYKSRGDEPQVVAQYRDLRNRLRKVNEVLAGTKGHQVVNRIRLDGLSRRELTDSLRRHIALSAGTDEVYGVYKVDLTFPGEVLGDLRHVRFVDLYGFGEPNPLINIKYTRFISEERIDALIYVLPDRSITEDFYRLFRVPGFLDEIVRKKRLFLVLNKADAYTDSRPGQWDRAEEQFRTALAKHVPVLRQYASQIPLFIMSAASVDAGAGGKQSRLRRESLRNLQRLRGRLRELSLELEAKSSEVTLYLGGLFDLLGSLDALAQSVALNLKTLEKRIPVIAGVIDEIAQHQSDFQGEKQGRMEAFRAVVAQKVRSQIESLPYESYLPVEILRAALGEPRGLFRAMLVSGQQCAENVYIKHIGLAVARVGQFANEKLLRAFREYCSRQDGAVLKELEELGAASRRDVSPLSVTVEQGAREFLQLARDTNLHMSAKELFDRFVNWYFENRCEWDSSRGRPLGAIKQDVVENVRRAVETFTFVYVFEDPEKSTAFLRHICVGGEKTFWRELMQHVGKLEDILENQVRIARWKLGLYQNKRIFVSRQPGYLETRDELLKRKAVAEELILEMI